MATASRKWIVWLSLVAALLLLNCAAVSAQSPEEKVAAHLQQCSVTIKKNSNDRGSGTIITRLVEGVKVNFVLTAHHVVEDLRTVKTVTTSDGKELKQVTYKDVEILQEKIDESTGERVGQTTMIARVICADEDKDIALLRIRAKNWRENTIVFYDGGRIPAAGLPVIHCASPGGQEIGAGSVLYGNIARVGCRIEEFSREPFDQIASPGLPGSSGGMVTTADGKFIGMITLGLRGADSFHWMVPLRVIAKWAKEVKAEWLIATDGKTTEEELKKLPLENARPGFAAMEAKNKPASSPATNDKCDCSIQQPQFIERDSHNEHKPVREDLGKNTR